MPRTRQQNVTAAQWTANCAALGAPDLTEPGSYPFGDNVFNLAVQKERLPRDVFRQLQATLDRGQALDP
jgi:glutamine synthetase